MPLATIPPVETSSEESVESDVPPITVPPDAVLEDLRFTVTELPATVPPDAVSLYVLPATV